jgi:hypothetical protein
VYLTWDESTDTPGSSNSHQHNKPNNNHPTRLRAFAPALEHGCKSNHKQDNRYRACGFNPHLSLLELEF